jgi:hypothetical protein
MPVETTRRVRTLGVDGVLCGTIIGGNAEPCLRGSMARRIGSIPACSDGVVIWGRRGTDGDRTVAAISSAIIGAAVAGRTSAAIDSDGLDTATLNSNSLDSAATDSDSLDPAAMDSDGLDSATLDSDCLDPAATDSDSLDPAAMDSDGLGPATTDSGGIHTANAAFTG